MNTGAIAQTGYAQETYWKSQNTQNTQKSQATEKATKTSRVTTGRTYGNPELSDEAKKYYEQLTKKFSNMDFVLVDSAVKDEARANVAQFAGGNRTVVLIDTEKIERMAHDEAYRKQYEGIISSSQVKLDAIKVQLQKSGKSGNVVTYGMELTKQGVTSLFAVLKKSRQDQKARLEKNAEKKAKAKKVEKKKAEKKRAEERKEVKAEEAKDSKRPDEAGKAHSLDDEELVEVHASTVEELMEKIDDFYYEDMSDSIRTPEEEKVGQKFDYAI